MRHAHGVLAAVIVGLSASRSAITELLVEGARAVVRCPQLEMNFENPGSPSRGLEPLEQLPAHALTLVTGLDGQQVQMRMDCVKFHDGETDDAAPIARGEYDAVAVAQAPRDAILVPRPRQAVLDEQARHRRDARSVVEVSQP
jgi:hypothetical protein